MAVAMASGAPGGTKKPVFPSTTSSSKAPTVVATTGTPHILILDEPTNHLHMESREALIEALTAYTGAVILVSHDMHLLAHVADRL